MAALSPAPRQNLLDLDRAALERFCLERGHKPFRARQLLQWIHRRGEADFAAMTDLSKAFRQQLEALAQVRVPDVLADNVAPDGTRKWLFALEGGNAVETVFIPETGRGTLCVSSQVGCAVDCAFCATGAQGFNRNLTTGEIIAQLWWASRCLRQTGTAVTNVVFMGMGEPLLNLPNVLPALRLMVDDLGYGLSKRRVTVSTSGIVPAMDRLRDGADVALAVSLHAAEDALRDELVPINRKYPLTALMAACRRYVAATERRMHITFEYVLLGGVNDRPGDARALARLLQGVPAKVNLIPFNPFPGARFVRPEPAQVAEFQRQLQSRGLLTTTRKTRGDEIDAACGQLAGQVMARRRPAVPA